MEIYMKGDNNSVILMHVYEISFEGNCIFIYSETIKASLSVLE